MSTEPAESLQERIEQAYTEWVAEHGLNQGIIRDWILIVGGVGFSSDGDDVEQVMVIPHGPYYALQGLLVEADTRFRAESVAAVINPEGDEP